MAYDPKTSSVTIDYMVKAAGNPFFIAGSVDRQQYTGIQDYLTALWAACQALSPKGTEKVAP